MKILIIDDAFETIAPRLCKKDLSVIVTGPSNSALQGAAFIQQYPEAEVILLDNELGEEITAGLQILRMLPKEVRKKVMCIAGETLSQKDFQREGVVHTPGKDVDHILQCINKECACGQDVQHKLVGSTCDLLVTSDSSAVLKALEKVFTMLLDLKGFITLFVESKELLQVLQDHHPRVVFYQASRGNPMRGAEHDYGHLCLKEEGLPPFHSLYGKAILSDFSPERKKEAEALGHVWCSENLADMIRVINTELGIGFDREKRLASLKEKAQPMLDHPKREELAEIARTMSPDSAKGEAFRVTHDEKVARATRNAKLLRREFGPDEFENFVGGKP